MDMISCSDELPPAIVGPFSRTKLGRVAPFTRRFIRCQPVQRHWYHQDAYSETIPHHQDIHPELLRPNERSVIDLISFPRCLLFTYRCTQKETHSSSTQIRPVFIVCILISLPSIWNTTSGKVTMKSPEMRYKV